MRTFKVLFRDKRIAIVQGDRLWSIRDHEAPNEERIIEILIDGEEQNRTVAVFPIGQIVGVFEGDLQETIIHGEPPKS